MEFDLNTRVIDLTLGQLGAWMDERMIQAVIKANSLRPTVIDGIHPDTGIPEGPMEYVSDVRAREILGTKEEPLKRATLYKYKLNPVYDPAGRNTNGGKSLPANKIGARCQYLVADLLALKKDKNCFIRPKAKRSKYLGT